jgi:hypothetical protein
MPNKLSIEWSTKKFNQFLQDFIKQTNADTSLVLRKFMFDLMTRVIYRTPVATGRARAGWTAAGNALGIKIPKPNRRAPGDAAFDLGEYEEKLTGPKQFIRVANNVDYILPLEYGWSKQAPAGMVRISMAELRSGRDLTTELMEEYQDSWGELSGKMRYKTQRKMMSGLMSEVKNMDLGPRRPK